MLSYLYVAIGSAAGGLARFVVGTWLQRRLDDLLPHGNHAPFLPFPIGTLLVNVSGSFLIGVLIVAMARQTAHSNVIYLLLVVGLCGGYTTFSTFSADTIGLIESGAVGIAALNVAASLALAFAATFAGFFLARALMGRWA